MSQTLVTKKSRSIFLGSLLRHQFHLWNHWGACCGSGSRKPEVKIFRNERFRLIRRFRTRYGRTEIRPDIFWGSLLGCPFHIRKPSSPRSGSVSRRPEVKIFRNERFRHPKIFNMHQGPGTRYGWSGVRYSGSGAYGIISFRVVV